jgi:hypothetical protein
MLAELETRPSVLPATSTNTNQFSLRKKTVEQLIIDALDQVRLRPDADVTVGDTRSQSHRVRAEARHVDVRTRSLVLSLGEGLDTLAPASSLRVRPGPLATFPVTRMRCAS